jgi:thiol-disulfide isomerase/thioredoxin/uncharacterized membrane protein YphA (DoxX/SURF4 family)
MTTTVLALRAVLVVVFAAAGVGKLLDLAGSRRAVRDFGVPDPLARTVGVVLPLAELAVAAALLFRPSARWGAAAALVLLGGFIAGIARALARGEQPDCHCFGQIHSAPAGRVTLARNAVLAALAGVIVGYGSGPAVDTWVRDRSAAELVAVAVGIVAVASVTYALTSRSDIRRLTRDLDIARQAAARWRGLPVGFDAPDFSLRDLQGRPVTLPSLLERGHPVLLAFMSPWCGPCEMLLPRVQQWQQTLSERLTLAVISTGTTDQNSAFDEQGLEDVLLQDDMEVANLYGIAATPSAIFISREGKIASTVGETEFGIEPLLRLALRQTASETVGGSVA